MNENVKKVILFIFITFLLTWAIEISFWLSGGKWIGTSGNFSLVIGLLVMMIPFFSVVIVEKVIYKANLKELGISFKVNVWWLVAWILPVIIVIFSSLVSLLMPDVSFSPTGEGIIERYKYILPPEEVRKIQTQISETKITFWQQVMFSIVSGMVAGLTINAVFAFGEEFGWRGFLVKYLGKMGFWKHSILVGLIWGIWHAPIILQGHNYPIHRIEGVFMMIAFCTLWSPIFTYIRIQSKSVIPSAIMHGTINGTAGISFVFLKGGTDLSVGVVGFAGLIVLLVANIFMLLKSEKIKYKTVEELISETQDNTT